MDYVKLNRNALYLRKNKVINIEPVGWNQTPVLVEELLNYQGFKVFNAYRKDKDRIVVETDSSGYEDNLAPLNLMTPYLATPFATSDEQQIEAVKTLMGFLREMRFFDLIPNAMRVPSAPGQTNLGDRGENFSSVLYAICLDPQQKQTLLNWMEELTPMDAVDFEFPADQIGRILLTVVERNGQRTSAYSLSDGTLRFLAILAAFLGPERAKFYFFEELENGIHPTRLHLLTQFIENQVARGDIQVVASTHSPLLLNYIKPETLEYASLLYRLENQPDAHIRRIVDIPNARQLIEKQGVMRLYESGWFEDVLFLLDDEAPEVEAVA